MKRSVFHRWVLAITAICILVPAAVLILWSVTGRWPWPNLLPATYSLRTVKELLFGSAKLHKLLFSSISLAFVVALIGTAIAMMTARATEIYKIPGRSLIQFGSFLPLLVPGTVFAMGIQITLIKLGLSDTLAGVAIVHLVTALPYCITIMTDVTAALGTRLEEQAAVLGAGRLRTLFSVTIPQLLPGILSSMSMAFILSYSQYFTTLLAGGGRVRTLALVLVPYIQSGDRSLSAIYSVVFIGSALLVFFIFEALLHRTLKGGKRK